MFLAAAPLLWLREQIHAGLLEHELGARLGELIGRKVTVGSLEMGWTGGLYIDRVGVAGSKGEAPLFLLGRVRVDYSYWKLFTGLLAVDSITFERPTLRLVRNADGTFNFSDILRHLARAKPATASRGKPAQPLSLPEHPQDVPEIPLGKLAFEGLEVSFEDRAVQPPVTQSMRNFELTLQMPGPNKPVVVELSGHTGTAHVLLRGNFYLAPLVGRAEFSLNDFTLAGLEPYLRKLPLPLEKPELELDVDGWLDVGEHFLSMESGQPKLDMTALRYGAELTVPSMKARLPGGTVGLKLAASVMTGSARLNDFELNLGDTRILDATGTVDDFRAPSFDFRVHVSELAVAKALAFVPKSALPEQALDAVNRIEPQGVLNADIRAVGTPSKPLVSGELSARDLAVVLPFCTVDLSLERLGFTPSTLDLRGLELRALGGKVALTALVDDALRYPAVSFALDAQTPALNELPLELPLPQAAGRAKVEVRGGLNSAKLLAANRCASVLELAKRSKIAGFEPVAQLAGAARQELDRLRRIAAGVKPETFLTKGPCAKLTDKIDWKALAELERAADLPRIEELVFRRMPETLRAIRDLLGLRLQTEIRLERLQAQLGSRLASADGLLELEAERGFSTKDLVVSFGPLRAGIKLALLKPLEMPELEASLQLAPPTGTIPVSSLASLAPSTVQARLSALELDPAAKVGFNAAGRLTAGGPEGTAELFAESVAAGKPPYRVRAGTIRVNANESGLKVPRFTLACGPVRLAVELAATKQEGLKLSAKTADPAGVDLAAAAAMVPLTNSAEATRWLTGGRLAAELTASADLSDARVLGRMKLHHPIADVGVAARGQDLLGAGKLDFLARVSVPKLSRAVAMLPRTAAAQLEPFDLSGAGAELRVTATGDFKKLKLGGGARFPGGQSVVTGEVDSLLPFGRAWASIGSRLAKQEELLAILPPAMRTAIERFHPETDVRLALNIGVEKGRSIVEQTFELATARASVTTMGMTIPIDLSGTRGAARATFDAGRKPVIDADLSGLRARTVVKDVPIEVTSQGGFHMETTSAHLLGAGLAVNGEPIRFELAVADPWTERRADARMVVDHWRLAPWVERFVPREKSVVVTGTATLGAHAAGRFPFLVGDAWLELAGVHVDAPQLRGLGAGAPLIRARILPDDIVVDNADIVFGARRFHLPLLGSLKQIVGVKDLYKADPKQVGPILLDHMGGVDGIKGLLGEQQIERLILDQTLKIIIWVRARDYPDTFVFKNVLPPEDKAQMAQAPQAVVAKHLVLAKQALAEKMGFPKRIYGDQNYRMINVYYAKARVLDEQLNSVYPEFIPFWRLTTTPAEW